MDYYIPHQIRFSKPQILFLLKNYHIIKEGNWVQPNGEIIENGYDLLRDTSIAHINGNAMVSSPPASDRTLNQIYYKEKILQIYNELNDRLSRCADGELLIARFANRVPVRQLCDSFKIQRQQVYHRCQRAIKYLSGRKAKKTNYKTWLQNKGN